MFAVPAFGTSMSAALRSSRSVGVLIVPSSRRSMTPKGQPATQVPQPLQTSFWTTTVSNSVRKSAPVGHTSRQPACVQCLHTSEDISQRKSAVSGGVVSTFDRSVGSRAPGASRSTLSSGVVGSPAEVRPSAAAPKAPSSGCAAADSSVRGRIVGMPRLTSLRPDSRAFSMRSASCSMNATCRQVFAPRLPVLS